MSRRAVERLAGEAVLMPSCSMRSTSTHLDFPGTISVRGETFIQYVTDIGLSLAHHGFKKILIVNGHGSNVPYLDIVARNITNATPSIAAMVPWWNLVPKELFKSFASRNIRRAWRTAANSNVGSALPCGELVQMDKAARDIPVQRSEYFYWDLQAPSPVFFQEFFSRYSKTARSAIRPRRQWQKASASSRRLWTGWWPSSVSCATERFCRASIITSCYFVCIMPTPIAFGLRVSAGPPEYFTMVTRRGTGSCSPVRGDRPTLPCFGCPDEMWMCGLPVRDVPPELRIS
jgi:creatinine amidohydrolase/Fe(II)-dependent formamide hydrolase-like protein